MKRKNQRSFFQQKPHRSGTKARLIQRGLGFGGELNYRKTKRPFDAKRCTHIILRSRLLSGARSLLKSNRKQWVENLIEEKAKKYQSKIYKHSVNSNHLHLLMKFPTAEAQANFLRDFSGTLALKIKKAFKFAKTIKIWDGRPFSRLLTKGAYPAIVKYIEKNLNEAAGFWAYTQRPLSQLAQALEKWRGKQSKTKKPPSSGTLRKG